MPPPTPALPDELLEEIFLRLPPDEPACLVRASLASKLWLTLLSAPTFHARYRGFHGAPPMLGFVYSLPDEPGYLYRYSGSAGLRFVSTAKFGAHVPSDKKFDVFDCRHGRLLLGDKGLSPKTLLVCDPMTGYWRELYTPKDCSYYGHVAAVLCGLTGCDHRACHGGPSRVVFVSLDMGDGEDIVAHARVSSLQQTDGCSELDDEWSEPSSHLHVAEDAFIELMPPVLLQDALYIMLTYEDDDHVGILKYDLGDECLVLIDAPTPKTGIAYDVILISMEDGSLGFAHVDGSTLNIWSRQLAGSAWTHRHTVINDLENLLSTRYPWKGFKLIGSVEGRDIIFVTTDPDIYQINLKSLLWKKIWKSQDCTALFPYMRFHTRPGLKPWDDGGSTKVIARNNEFFGASQELVHKNNLEKAKCKVGRGCGVRQGLLVPGRLRSYYWGPRYGRRQPRAPNRSRRRATRKAVGHKRHIEEQGGLITRTQHGLYD